MTVTYHSGRRIQGTSTDVAVVNRGTITTDGSYTVIKFTENGKFTPTSSFNVEYLVVGGGGAGGAGSSNSGAGAGGGAGGYITATGHAVTAQDYNIIVGTGGTGRSTIGQGEDGGDSTFDNITSIGGGGGGFLTAGGTGGSGGGSGNNGTAGASGTAGQGNSGGAGQYRSGGGGGGAGSAGSSSTSSSGGAGGNGISSSITGSSVIYSAGGGGAGDSSGGNGGSSNTGGVGVPNGTGQAGTGVVNTGSGGGGTYAISSHPSGSGANGVVILRFLTSGNTYDTSLGGKPTNVQAGSRFEETDTRKMYNYEITPTYEDDFSSYADQNAADAAWVSNDTADFRVNITNDNFAFDSKVTSTTNTGAYYDLGTALSDTAWVVDFKLVITTNTLYSSGAVNAATYITMNDATNGGAIGGTVDAMGFYISGSSSGSKFNVTWANSSYLNRGGGEFTNTITTGTFYMRLKRTGATSVKLEVYSNAARTTLIEQKEVTGTDSGITGLQYFRIQDNQSSAGTGTGQQIGTIDDIKIYDGVTSPSSSTNYTWQEIGA